MAERKPNAFVACFVGRESMSRTVVESMTCGHMTAHNSLITQSTRPCTPHLVSPP